MPPPPPCSSGSESPVSPLAASSSHWAQRGVVVVEAAVGVVRPDRERELGDRPLLLGEAAHRGVGERAHEGGSLPRRAKNQTTDR